MRTEGTAAVNNVINAMWTKFGTAARALTMKQWRAQVRSAGRRFMARQKKKAGDLGGAARCFAHVDGLACCRLNAGLAAERAWWLLCVC